MRNARREAIDLLLGRDARVLEPSPPTVTEGPYFADDPVAPGDPGTVGPTSAFAVTWDDLAQSDPVIARFAREHWLGGWGRLLPAPDALVSTRLALHRVAEDVMKPAREAATGKFGLRYTRGGFGTPFFGNDEQLRVEHGVLVHRSAGEEVREALDGVDLTAARFLGDWFGFAASVLEELRAGAGAALEPSRVQLWPEHFDLAVELGSADAGRRAAYGLSPGDESHDEPYAYVAPFDADRMSADPALWNATAFGGAELSYAELTGGEDQRRSVLAWLRERVDALSAAE